MKGILASTSFRRWHRLFRAHFRDPSFANLQALAMMTGGDSWADVVVALADPVLGGVTDEPHTRTPWVRLQADAAQIIARYLTVTRAPRCCPMLHLIQSATVTSARNGIDLIAATLTCPAQTTAPSRSSIRSTKRHPTGDSLVGVCIERAGCAVMGGDDLGKGLREGRRRQRRASSEDGKITLERIGSERGV